MSDDDILGEGKTDATHGGAARAERELKAAFDDVEALLKNGDVVSALSARGINASLALVAVAGLRAYVEGDKAAAAEDLGTVAEEIRGRAELSKSIAADKRREEN